MLKTNRGFNLQMLSKAFGMDNAGDEYAGMRDFMKKVMLQAGINHIVQVNDCETSADWTESDNGTFDYAVAATGKRVGTNCLSLTATAACDNSQYVQTKYVNESVQVVSPQGENDGMDWTDTKYVGFWKHAESSGDFGTDGELQFALVYADGTVSAKTEVTGLTTTVHDWMEVDISGLTRTDVVGIRFYCNNANAGEAVYIDDIIRYDISYGGFPLYGGFLPIKSAEALAVGDTIDWSIDGAVKSTAAAVTNLGTGIPVTGAALTGTGKRDKFVHVPGVFVCMVTAGAATVAGEGLIWKANGTVEGVSTGVEEYVMYKGLEAAGAAGDVIFAVKTIGGHFIS